MAKDKIKSDEPSRAALAAAITDAEQSLNSLEIARQASRNAEAQMYEAIGKLDELRKQDAANSASPDKILESLAAASPGFDVLAPEIPGEAARMEAAKVENGIAAWRRAHALAEQEIPNRKLAVEQAGRQIEAAARAVIGKSCTSARCSRRLKSRPLRSSKNASCLFTLDRSSKTKATARRLSDL
jgi:hypothetical protein